MFRGILNIYSVLIRAFIVIIFLYKNQPKGIQEQV